MEAHGHQLEWGTNITLLGRNPELLQQGIEPLAHHAIKIRMRDRSCRRQPRRRARTGGGPATDTHRHPHRSMETARGRRRRPYPTATGQPLSRLPHRRAGRSGPGTQGGHRGIWVHADQHT
eukprot:6655687-Pyramimonas_sp.AAC.1